MERAVLVYTTWPSIVEAEAAGRKIVEKRLAACVNILPGMISHYWWQGKIERAEEVVMIVKTRASLAERGRRGGEGIAQLYDPGDHGLAGGKPRPGLSRLDRGGDLRIKRNRRASSPAIRRFQTAE